MDRAIGKMVGISGSAISSTTGQLLTSAEIEEVRGEGGVSCGSLDREFDAEEETSREMYSLGGKPVCTGPDPTAARSQTSAGLCVFFFWHHQSMNEKNLVASEQAA